MNAVVRRLAPALLAGLLLGACTVEIQHDLNEREANEILVLLERKGIPVKKELSAGGKEPTWTISVPKAHAANAAMLLKENELPRPRIDGFELFNKGSLIPTATEERAMFLKALSGELSKSIMSIDGVLDARVHVNIPQSDELTDKDKRPLPSAAVLVKFRNTAEPGKKAVPPISAKDIQDIVSRSVQDLAPDNVSVVMTPASPPGALDDPANSVVDVLGIRMAAESVNAFRAILGTLVFVILALAGYIVFSKSRDLRPAPRPRARPEA